MIFVFFLWKRLFELERVNYNFCSFPRISYSQPTKFDESIFNKFWGVLCQPVHPESNISHFLPFSLLDSDLWFFVESHRRVKKNNFKTIFAPSLELLPISGPNLVN